MEGNTLDSFYNGIFKKVDGYTLFQQPGNGLLNFKVVEIPANADEILLMENKEKIQEFLDKMRQMGFDQKKVIQLIEKMLKEDAS